MPILRQDDKIAAFLEIAPAFAYWYKWCFIRLCEYKLAVNCSKNAN